MSTFFFLPPTSLFVILLHTHTHTHTHLYTHTYKYLYSLFSLSALSLSYLFSSLSPLVSSTYTHTHSHHTHACVCRHTHTHSLSLLPLLFSFCVLSSINTSLLPLCFSLTYSLHLSNNPIFKLQGSHLMTDMLTWSSFQFIPLSWSPIPLSQRWVQLCDFSDKPNNGICYAATSRSGLCNMICSVFVCLSPWEPRLHALSKPREKDTCRVLATAPSNVSAQGQHQQFVK